MVGLSRATQRAWRTRQARRDAPLAIQAQMNRRNLVVLLPLLLFLLLAGLFFYRLSGGDPSRVPSALIGREAPPTNLPALEGLAQNGTPVPGLGSEALKGKVSVVNVWAS